MEWVFLYFLIGLFFSSFITILAATRHVRVSITGFVSMIVLWIVLCPYIIIDYIIRNW